MKQKRLTKQNVSSHARDCAIGQYHWQKATAGNKFQEAVHRLSPYSGNVKQEVASQFNSFSGPYSFEYRFLKTQRPEGTFFCCLPSSQPVMNRICFKHPHLKPTGVTETKKSSTSTFFSGPKVFKGLILLLNISKSYWPR